jgi:uncharacterized protein YkwD
LQIPSEIPPDTLLYGREVAVRRMPTRKNKHEAKVEAARGAPDDDTSAVAVNVPISGLAQKASNIIWLVFGLAVAMPLARAEDMAAMISQYRREHGLPAVKTDPQLTAVAERQARAMAASGILDHDVVGSFASRIAGAHTDSAAENIAAGTKTWADTLRLWESSPGHNANLLRAGADSVGVAVARNDEGGPRYKVFWAMVIGHKESKEIARTNRPATAVPAAAPAPSTTAAPNLNWLGDLVASGRRLILGQ